ncbi:MAG: cardiolipin synthase, partial [Clostridiales bacterium]|nr:cardiolipin synthase [Clostridiales bacterium]
MGRIKKIVFSRLFFTALFVIAEVLVIAALVYYLSAAAIYIYIFFQILSFAILIWLFQTTDNPSYKLMWALFIVVIPALGGIFYILFGGKHISREMRRRFNRVYPETSKCRHEVDKNQVDRVKRFDPALGRQAEYIANVAGAPVFVNSDCKYFPSGEAMFVCMLEELKKARRFIFMEYFIIERGIMWDSILEILKEKAQSGVDVRILYDDIGCSLTLPRCYPQKLRSYGFRVGIFNRFKPRLDAFMNSRDHRKVCVIDGNVGFMGGINLADEYINQKPRFGYWKDSAVMVRGDAVAGMTKIFSELWLFTIGERIPLEKFAPTQKFKTDGFVQPFGDQPLDECNVAETAYLTMINHATKYLYITTPYLILDNEAITSLCMAARSDVDVRIICPGIPDKKMVFLVTQSYYEQLVRAGVKIYEYQAGFVHSKMFVCDDKVAIVGSANMDYRSLYLHFECCTAFYYSSVVAAVKNDIIDMISHSTE